MASTTEMTANAEPAPLHKHPYHLVDPMEVRLIYLQIVKDLSAKPSRDQRRAADSILGLGR